MATSRGEKPTTLTNQWQEIPYLRQINQISRKQTKAYTSIATIFITRGDNWQVLNYVKVEESNQ